MIVWWPNQWIRVFGCFLFGLFQFRYYVMTILVYESIPPRVHAVV